MKNQEINNRIEKLEAELAELKNQVNAKPEQLEAPYWVPDKDDHYYYVDEVGDVCGTNYEERQSDRWNVYCGNAFITEKEAELARDKQVLITEILRWKSKHDPESFDKEFILYEDKEKFLLILDCSENKIIADYAYILLPLSPVGYFTARDIAISCIEHFGDRLRLLI